MSTTPEYNTLISLTDELRLAVQPNLVSLSGSLMAKYLITPEKANQLRNQMHSEADRAANLVDIIRNKVLQNAQHYHTFVQVMESQGRKYYHDILNKLDEVYQQLKFNANSQQSASQAPGPASVSRSDIKQRYSHRIGICLGSYSVRVAWCFIFIYQNPMVEVPALRSILDPGFLLINQTPLYMLANYGVTF